MIGVSAQYLQIVEDTLQNVMFTDVCTIYNALNSGSSGLGSPDGEGGYGDNEGGSTTTFDNGTSNIPCKMDQLTGGGESQKSQNNTSKTRQILYVPSTTTVYKTSVVVTAAGNNGVNRRFEVIDIYRESGQVDIGLLLETLTDGNV